MSTRSALVPLLVATLLAPPVGSGQQSGSVPPIDCVRLLREARIAEADGDAERALVLLGEAVDRYPDEVAPLLALQGHYSRHELVGEDERRVRRLLGERLADPDSPLPSGTLRQLVENPDSDRDELAFMLEAVERRLAGGRAVEPRLLQAAAALQVRLERFEQARETLGRLLALEPSDRLRWQCAELDIALERWESAIPLLRELAKGPTSTRARLFLIDVLSRLGRSQDCLEQIELLAPGDVELETIQAMRHTFLRDLAWDLRDAGNDAEAERIFRQLLAEDPKDAEARAVIAHVYAGSDERERLLADSEGRWQEEDDPDAVLERGAALLASGDAYGAIDLLERAASALRDNELAWFNLGVAALRLERWELAEQASARAAEINPRRADAFLNRGTALQRLGRCEEAVTTLDRALALRPELGQAHYYLWLCHRALRNSTAAAEHLSLYDEYQASQGD